MRAFLRHRLPIFAAALWWGGLAAVGFIAVPLVFAHAPSVAVAGPITAKMFTATSWLGAACGMLLVLCLKPALDAPSSAAESASAESASSESAASAPAPSSMALSGWALAGVIAALLIEFAVAPRIVARENLHIWHNLGSALFVLQWLCAGVLLYKLSARR